MHSVHEPFVEAVGRFAKGGVESGLTSGSGFYIADGWFRIIVRVLAFASWRAAGARGQEPVVFVVFIRRGDVPFVLLIDVIVEFDVGKAGFVTQDFASNVSESTSGDVGHDVGGVTVVYQRVQ